MCSNSKGVHFVHFFTSFIFINLDFLLLLNMLVLKNTFLLHEHIDIFNYFFFNYDQTYWPIFNNNCNNWEEKDTPVSIARIMHISRIQNPETIAYENTWKLTRKCYFTQNFIYCLAKITLYFSVGDRVTPMTWNVALHLASNDITLKK